MEYEWSTTITSPPFIKMMQRMFLQYEIMLEMKEYENQMLWGAYRDKKYLNDLEINLMNN